jgi:dihydroorotate dehydrogenase (fumarate)
MSVDLRTRYLGFQLRSPIVASAAPQNAIPSIAERLERSGAGAIVLPSLFEEEVIHEQVGLTSALEQGTEAFAEALDYFPAVDTLVDAAERYVTSLTAIKARTSVPIIASLNARTHAGWVRFARLMADAGADALELNLYHVAADRHRAAADIERTDLETIAAVRAAIDIPIAVKLAPYYSALANFVSSAFQAGADGLVLFNRFYQPEVDLETLDVVPRIELSTQSELRLPVRWVAILRAQFGPGVSLAASSGVHSGADVVKALAVGADVAMMTSALLRHGPERLAAIEAELRAWLLERDYETVEQLRGSASAATAADPAAFERANYLATLRSWTAPPRLEPGSPTH